MKKLISIVLALLLAMSMFSFASAAAGSGEYIDGIWHYDEPVTVKIAVAYWAEFTDDPSVKWAYSWIEDKMNIKIEVVNKVPYSAIDEQTNLLFAGNDLPDALMGFHNISGTKYGDESGQLLAIDELIDPEICPNLAAVVAELPVKEFISSPSGHYYKMPEIMEDPANYPSVCYTPMVANKALFQEAGYEEFPADLDTFIEALEAIKDLKGEDFIPFGGNNWAVLNPVWWSLGNYGWYEDLYTFVGGDYLSGGEMVATGLSDNYYEFLQIARKMFEEGLMDPDFYTLDDAQVLAKAKEGLYGAFPSWGYATQVPDGTVFDWYYFPNFTSEYCDDPHHIANDPVASSALMSICSTASEEAIEALLRIADLCYDPTYKYYTQYGPDQNSNLYGVVEIPVWRFKDADEGVGIVNMLTYNDGDVYKSWTDALTWNSLMTWSGCAADRRSPSAEWYTYDPTNPDQFPAYTYIQAYLNIAAYRYNGGSFTGLDAERNQDLSTALSDYLKAETAKFITGARELNDDEWAKFKQDMLDLGYEEYMDLQQGYFEANY